MQPIKILHLKVGVSKIKYLGNGIVAIVDELNTLRLYDVNEFKLVGGFKIKLPKNNPIENSIDVSLNGKYIAIAVRGKRKIAIWSIPKKRLLYSFGWHKGDILTVSFDRESKYLISGGEDGRAYVWSLQTGKMVFTLPPHADYVLSSDFSLNSLWCATGSYDRSVSITNLSAMDFTFRKRAHTSAVSFIKFFHHHKMVSGSKTGELIVWNYPKGEVFKRLDNVNDMVLDIAFSNDYKYMFVVANNTKKLAFFDLEEYSLITDEFVKIISSPTTIEFIAELNYIVIGTIDGEVIFYDLYQDEKELRKFINEKNFEKAYELVYKNPFLRKSNVYLQLEKYWEDSLQKAQLLLEKGEVNTAKSILAPFLKVSLKRAFIQNLLKDFLEFEKFKLAVEKRKYPLAYSLVAKYPFLKETKYYKIMEQDWKKRFTKAKELILRNGSEDEVKEILKPFRGVSQKTPFIQALFNEKKLYNIFTQKLMKKEFEEFFDFVNRYPFLVDTEEYQKAVKYGGQLLNKAKELLKEGEYKKVLNITDILIKFPMYKDEALELKKEATILAAFQRALANKDFVLIEKYIKEYPFLEESEDYKKFEKEWEDKFEIAQKYASEYRIDKVLEILSEYMGLKEKRYLIGQLIKSAYLQQILDFILKYYKKELTDTTKIEKAIRNYISIFGFDMEIGDLIEKAKKLKIDVNLSGVKEGTFIDWYTKKLPNDISEI